MPSGDGDCFLPKDHPWWKPPLIILVCENEPTHIAKLLACDTGDPNITDNQGRTAMHYAAEQGKTGLLSYMASKGGDVNARDKHGTTPLHAMCTEHSVHNPRTVKYLKGLGCLVNSVDNEGNTPLHKAVHFKNFQMVDLLLEVDADVARLNLKGQVPLGVAHPDDCAKMEMLFKEHM
jgi:ankyrin repeat protein